MTTELTTIATPSTHAIRMTAMGDLYLHPINPRQEASDTEIGLLAQSIKACGLIQSIAGILDSDGKIGIVAGGRRLRALQALAKSGDWNADIPVRLASSEAQAEEWANAENTARADLDPADEIRAYGRMSTSGKSVSEIGVVFAVTEVHVTKRLKLSTLWVAVWEPKDRT